MPHYPESAVGPHVFDINWWQWLPDNSNSMAPRSPKYWCVIVSEFLNSQIWTHKSWSKLNVPCVSKFGLWQPSRLWQVVREDVSFEIPVVQTPHVLATVQDHVHWHKVVDHQATSSRLQHELNSMHTGNDISANIQFVLTWEKLLILWPWGKGTPTGREERNVNMLQMIDEASTPRRDDTVAPKRKSGWWPPPWSTLLFSPVVTTSHHFWVLINWFASNFAQIDTRLLSC